MRLLSWTTIMVAASAVAALSSAPAQARPVSLRAFADEQVRVATIAYRMAVSNRDACTQPQKLSGLILHDLSEYDPSIRPAVSRAFSLGAGAGVIQIVPGSAAERAGLQIDDEIIAINGVSISDPDAASQRTKSAARVQRLSALLNAAMMHGPVQLSVRRHDTIIQAQLLGDDACGGELSLVDSNDENAWSDGTHVVVTTAMTTMARTTDEIAFVIAHEMAHNILGHSRSSPAGIFGLGGLSKSRNDELAADRFAVRLMNSAGYRPTGGVSFLEHARRRFWWSITLDHPGFGSRIRAVSAAISYEAGRQPARASWTPRLASFDRGSTELAWMPAAD